MEEKIEFTPEEVEMLEEIKLFPKVYNLSEKGITTIKNIFEKVKKISEQG